MQLLLCKKAVEQSVKLLTKVVSMVVHLTQTVKLQEANEG